MGVQFDYYYGREAEQFSFFRIPKLLFTDSMFNDLSSDAKVLYGILLDRMSLSMKNGWLDEEKKVYIIFTIEEIEETMNFGRNKAVKTMKELEQFGLVVKKRRGLGKPNILYVMSFLVNNDQSEESPKNQNEEFSAGNQRNKNAEDHCSSGICPEVSNINFQKFKKQTSRSLHFKLPEVSKINSNKTDKNKTEKYSDADMNNPTSISSAQGQMEQEAEKMETEEEIIEKIKKNIEYDSLLGAYSEEKSKIDLIISLMTEIILNKADMKINQSRMDYARVREQFLSIRKEHFEYILHYLGKSRQKITNLRAYLISLIYNAPINILGTSAHNNPEMIDYSKENQVWQDFLNNC